MTGASAIYVAPCSEMPSTLQCQRRHRNPKDCSWSSPTRTGARSAFVHRICDWTEFIGTTPLARIAQYQSDIRALVAS